MKIGKLTRWIHWVNEFVCVFHQKSSIAIMVQSDVKVFFVFFVWSCSVSFTQFSRVLFSSFSSFDSFRHLKRDPMKIDAMKKMPYKCYSIWYMAWHANAPKHKLHWFRSKWQINCITLRACRRHKQKIEYNVRRTQRRNYVSSCTIANDGVGHSPKSTSFYLEENIFRIYYYVPNGCV